MTRKSIGCAFPPVVAVDGTTTACTSRGRFFFAIARNCRQPIVGRVLATVFEPDVHLAHVVLRDETAEGRRVRSGDGGIRRRIGRAEDVLLETERAFLDGLDRRSDRIHQLNEDLAAVDRRNELFADRAQAHHRDREGKGARAEECDQPAVVEAPGQRALRVPGPKVVELIPEPVDDPPRFPVRAQRPEARQRRRDREGNEERGEGRDDDDDRELRDLPADLSLNERDRQKDDDVDERDDDRRGADLLAAVDGGVLRRLLELGKMALDVLEHDGRVVDENPDHERHAQAARSYRS